MGQVRWELHHLAPPKDSLLKKESQTKKVPVALIGHGHIGKWHAEKIYQHNLANFVAIVEKNEATFDDIQNKYPDVFLTNSLEEVLDRADAFIVASPTNTHFSILKTLIEHGKHIFCEKPLTSLYKESLLIEEAQRGCGIVIQVGHSERFHEVWEWRERYEHVLQSPSLIRTNRLGIFKGRSTDVDVVNDLMTHDLDIIYYLLKEIPETVHAFGYKTKTSKWDHVLVEASFPSKHRAFMAVGRNYIDEVRTCEFFNKDGCFFVDCHRHNVKIVNNQTNDDRVFDCSYNKRDHLFLQHDHFYKSLLFQEKNKNVAGCKDAVVVHKIVDGILESLDTGGTVTLL